MKVLVKNVKGTSKLQSPCSSWIEFWESKHRGRLYVCACCGSFKSKLNGCHVQKVFDKLRQMYIVPLCNECNQKTDYFEVDDSLLELASLP